MNLKVLISCYTYKYNGIIIGVMRKLHIHVLKVGKFLHWFYLSLLLLNILLFYVINGPCWSLRCRIFVDILKTLTFNKVNELFVIGHDVIHIKHLIVDAGTMGICVNHVHYFTYLRLCGWVIHMSALLRTLIRETNFLLLRNDSTRIFVFVFLFLGRSFSLNVFLRFLPHCFKLTV